MKRTFPLQSFPATTQLDWSPVFREVRCFDFLSLAVMIFLLAAGELFIYTTGAQIGTEHSMSFWPKQLMWIGVGTVGYFLLAHLDYRKMIVWIWLYYPVTILLLVIVLFVGKPINGANSWLKLGPIQVQPSEFAKLAVIWFLAALHGNALFKIRKTTHIFLSLAVLFVPFALIAIEPDFGSAIVLVPVGAAMMFTAGVRWKLLAFTILAAAVIGSALVANEVFEVHPLLKTYQRERIKTFFNPERDISHYGYNAYQSRLAVGSGGMWGKGIGEGTQNPLGFLPQAVSNNDFIFSVIAEETGFAGVAALLAGYAALLYTILRTAFLARDDFARQAGVGIGTLIFVHLFINVGMSVGLVPITGIPLPFLSYGGSFVVSMMLAMGFMQAVYRRNRLEEEEERDYSL